MKIFRYRALLFVAILIASQSLQSCRHPMYSYRIYKPEGGPSVTLKTGQTIADESVRMREPLFGRDKVVAGDQTFLAKEVKYYQTNTERYANVGKSTFARQLQGGALSLYRHQYTVESVSIAPGGRTSSSSRVVTVDYVQKGGPTAPIVLLEPKTLRPLVADYRPAKALMEREAQLRRKQRIVGYGCLGAAALGIGLIVAGSSGSSDGASTAAASGVGLMLISGITTFVKSAVYRNKRYAKMHEAVQSYGKKP